MSKYHININQSGDHSTSVIGDHTQLIAHFNTSSSVEDLLKVLNAIRREIDIMDIPADVKDEAGLEVEQAIIQAKEHEPDKPKLRGHLENIAEIVKRSATIALGVGNFWTLLRKAIEWVAG